MGRPPYDFSEDQFDSNVARGACALILLYFTSVVALIWAIIYGIHHYITNK